MHQAPLISVIVPAYNGETVLAAALQSVREQSYQNLEVLVVDDGSTDRTLEIARAAARLDARFQVFSQANTGVSGARNLAISHAKGDWLAFLDADDAWLPDKLRAQMALVAEDPQVNLLFSNYFLWDGQNNLGLRYLRPGKLPTGDVSARLIRSDLFGMSSVVVRRREVERVGAFDPEATPAEDWDFWLRMLEEGLRARGTMEPLVRYRVWSGNASKDRLRMAEANLRVLEKNAARTRRSDLRRLYRRSCRISRSNLELARARPHLAPAPDAVAASLLRAWLYCPSRLKWLFRYFMLRWPAPLGGRALTASVHRKIAAKW
jgi:glycosyltransferase involved in cell wall biosynthesis